MRCNRGDSGMNDPIQTGITLDRRAPHAVGRANYGTIRSMTWSVTWASLIGTAAILALAAGCAERAAIPPGAPPAVALPPLARDGDADAQVSLGYMYQTGQTIEQSYSQAAYWYRAAAEQDNSLAQFALGDLYAQGLGLDQDYGAAAYWFGRAAMAGNVSAQVRLAYYYEKGLGVVRDYGAAAHWYGQASQASRGLNAAPPAIERLAGRAYARAPVLTQPPRLVPLDQPAPKPNETVVLVKPETNNAATPTTGVSGAWVHVASFRTRGAAESQWDMLKSRHPVLLGGLTAAMVDTDLGDEMGVWIRVHAGPLTNQAVAHSLCDALHVRNVYCAPVTEN